jgi:hypothetical protein
MEDISLNVVGHILFYVQLQIYDCDYGYLLDKILNALSARRPIQGAFRCN